MKKHEIYVVIDSEEKRLRAVEILRNAGEAIMNDSSLLYEEHRGILTFDEKEWILTFFHDTSNITLDQLEALLNPNYVVKDVVLTLEELKLQAEKLGHMLVEKPYEANVGDFGLFLNDDEDYTYGFITNKDSSKTPFCASILWFENFRKLTDEEKQKIQEAW